MTPIEVLPVAGSLGAEVRGLSLKEPIAQETSHKLRAALLEHLVLFFPGQHLNTAQLQAFGATWGPLETDAPDKHVRSAEDPGVVELAASKGYTADSWHTDLTHMDNPPMGSVLSMVKLPPVGGDTMWSNQYKAYETLSAPMRDLIDGLTAIHEHPRMHTRAEHPLVRVHPETGRRHLYVNRDYTSRIVQMSRDESDAILKFLIAHSVEPRFTVRYRWSEGTIAIWDNRCTQHMVISDFTGERIIQRVTIAGAGPTPVESKWERYQPALNTISSRADRIDNDAPATAEKSSSVERIA